MISLISPLRIFEVCMNIRERLTQCVAREDGI